MGAPPCSGPESTAAASREMGSYIRALESQLSPIQVTRYPAHPSSPLAKCIKRLKCCRGNLGVQRLRWHMVGGLGKRWLMEDKQEKGQGEEGQKETTQHADIGETGLGTYGPGVDHETPECVSLKWEGSLFKLVKMLNPHLP